VIPFFKVDADTITGLLANICNQEKIRYELEGLQIIARMSRGHIRDAISRLETVAAVGGATKALVTSVLDDSLEDLCLKALLAVAMKQLTEAVRYGDEACRSNLPARVIETMFALYARSVFAEGDSQLGLIAAKLADAGEVSAIFLKWSSTPYLSADTIPLLIYELIGTVGSFRERQSGKGLSTPPPLLGQKMTTKDLMDILQAEELKN
jgi:DNA polymerase III gamma/tau subunit